MEHNIVKLMDSKGDEFLLNLSNVVMISPAINGMTEGKVWSDITLVGNNESVLFDIEFSEIKRVLEV